MINTRWILYLIPVPSLSLTPHVSLSYALLTIENVFWEENMYKYTWEVSVSFSWLILFFGLSQSFTLLSLSINFLMIVQAGGASRFSGPWQLYNMRSTLYYLNIFTLIILFFQFYKNICYIWHVDRIPTPSGTLVCILLISR